MRFVPAAPAQRMVIHLMESLSYILQASHFGRVGIVWYEGDGMIGIRRIFLPRGRIMAESLISQAFPGAGRRSCPEISEVGLRIRDFLAGRPVEFALDLVDLSRCSSFQRRVLFAESRIPRGWTSTYGRIARRIGEPKAARAVGSALARNPFPVIIPCHRAIREDGGLGGFQGGEGMKRELLTYEGIIFSKDGTVVSERVYY